jgi:thiaminase
MLLTKHENQTFVNQTVYISGQAFIGCTFTACTLILRETVYHLQNCTFERCNWHVDWVLMWGSPESLREIKALVSLIEQAQQQAEQQGAAGATEAPAAGSSSPFAS